MAIKIDVQLPDGWKDMRELHEAAIRQACEAMRIPADVLEPPYQRTGALRQSFEEQERQWQRHLQDRAEILELMLMIAILRKINLEMRVALIQEQWRRLERWKHIDNSGE